MRRVFEALLAPVGLVLLTPGLVWSGQQPRPLPEPLTLAQALELADEDHPVLDRARAELAGSRALLRTDDARDSMQVSLEGRARWFDEPQFPELEDGRDDHALTLVFRKPLWDFGRTDYLRAASEAEVEGKQGELIAQRLERRISIMKSFFEVLLTDIRYDLQNEAVAVAFYFMDRAEDQRELGQVSDVALLDFRSRYQAAVAARNRQVMEQRLSRERLALALNRPGQLPGKVLEPALAGLERPVPDDVQAFLDDTMANNPGLKAARQRVAAARDRVRAARAERRPLITGALETGVYSRELRSHDPVRLGIQVHVPIFTGGRTDAETAHRAAELRAARANLSDLTYSARLRVTELWLELDSLRADRIHIQSDREYSDLYLDQQTSLYELEKKTNVDDALQRMTNNRLLTAKNAYATTLTWARLDALLGIVPEQVVDNAIGREK